MPLSPSGIISQKKIEYNRNKNPTFFFFFVPMAIVDKAIKKATKNAIMHGNKGKWKTAARSLFPGAKKGTSGQSWSTATRKREPQAQTKPKKKRVPRESKAQKLKRLYAEMDSNPQSAVELAPQLFTLLNSRKNINETLAEKLIKYGVGPIFLEHCIEQKMKISPALWFQWYFKSGADSVLLNKIIDLLLQNEKKVTPQLVVNQFFNTVCYRVAKEDSMARLDALYRLKPLLDIDLPESIAVEDLKEYFFKWVRLSTLNVLESAYSRGQFVTVADCNGNRAILPDVRTTELLEYQLVENEVPQPGEILEKLHDDPNDITDETKDVSRSHLAVVESVDFNTGECTMKMYGPIPAGTVTFRKMTPLASYRSEIEALVTFVKRGPACTDAYDAIVHGVVKDTPPVPLRSLRISDVNQSQLTAIRGVMGRPVSLIQGPPGTGKTHTLSKLIQLLSRQYGRGSVLVATPTNAACDNVIDYCQRLGLRVVRTGDLSAVREDLLPLCLEKIVPNPFQNFGHAMKILRSADVVCTTCASSSSQLLAKIKFRYVIVDEASQLTETTALIPIVNETKSLILVGDHQQLPPSVGYWAAQEGYSESLFARLAKCTQPFMLDTQYRSHPMIMEFSSGKFYQGKLQSGVHHKDRPPPVGFPWPKCRRRGQLPIAFVNSDHLEQKHFLSKANEGEAHKLMAILDRFLKAGLNPRDIGIISPYAGQNRLLRQMLHKRKVQIEQNSVDAFQGREKELILFSATRAGAGLGFLSDPRRFNVMHTRAKRGLVIVGNRRTLQKDPTWAEWLRWVDQNQLEVKL
jgi:signal recognition particle GTPase